MSGTMSNNVPGGRFARLYNQEREKNLDLTARLGQVRMWLLRVEDLPADEVKSDLERLRVVLFPDSDDVLTLLEDLLSHDHSD